MQGGIIIFILSNIYLYCFYVYLDKLIIRTDFKLYYICYADAWFIDAWCFKKDAIKTREKIEIFLKEKLDLELSIEKTRNTHVGKEKVQFLG